MILGIPKRHKYSTPLKTNQTRWPFSIQEHNAKRAGKHHDLRLGPQGLSWAVRNWPEPGQKSLAKQTDDHSLGYYTYEGNIPSGYGAGDVVLKDSGETDILKSSPDKISFILKDRYLPKRYSLIRTQNRDWLLLNHTPKSDKYIIPEKSKYKKVKNLKPYIDNPRYLLSPKYDGAANIMILRNKKMPELFSYRQGKSGLIDHTFKTNLDKYLAKTDSNNPTSIWVETLAMHNNKPRHVSETAGLLNAALDSTRHGKVQFKNIAYNINQYKGKDVSKVPYKHKLELLKKIVKDNPYLEMPGLVSDPKSKSKLIESIKTKKHRDTSEGVVVYDLDAHTPLKSKFDTEFKVYIRGIQPGKGKFKNMMGGLKYSHSKTGPIDGVIGSGFSDEQRREFMDKKNIGKRVLIKAYEKLKSNALRMPIFIDFT